MGRLCDVNKDVVQLHLEADPSLRAAFRFLFNQLLGFDEISKEVVEGDCQRGV